MKKFLVSTILGITFTGAATASIVSRGFFEEAMENYATNTALDLKANQSDLTTLLEIVGTPAELTYWDALGDDIVSLFSEEYYNNNVNSRMPKSISEFIELNYTDYDFPGFYGIVSRLLSPSREDLHWPVRLYDIFEDYELLFNNCGSRFSFYDLLFYGTNDMNGRKAYGLPTLTTKVDENAAKIGTIDSENKIAGYDNLADALRAVDAKIDGKINNLSATASNGKYVLTAVKEGDQTTYAWESIDRAEME